jgi:hypothetical protein
MHWPAKCTTEGRQQMSWACFAAPSLWLVKGSSTLHSTFANNHMIPCQQLKLKSSPVQSSSPTPHTPLPTAHYPLRASNGILDNSK